MVENMIHIDAERLNRQYFYRGIKRLFDVVASAIGLVVISPVLLIIAICIKVDDPHGPVFTPKPGWGRTDTNSKSSSSAQWLVTQMSSSPNYKIKTRLMGRCLK
ncbi:sugar transferase [Limosilactobacillus fermentum]|nr:sugar transferase [Limosilactobacillus fermentum]